MQQETRQLTSQGEYIDDAKVEQPASSQEGMLSGLWHKVRDTTMATAHIAEMAAVIAGEAAHGLLDKGIGKAYDTAVAVEQVGEKIVEQTKEFVQLEAEKAATIYEDAKESVVGIAQSGKEAITQAELDLNEQAKEARSEVRSMSGSVGGHLQEFATIIVEQSKESTEESTSMSPHTQETVERLIASTSEVLSSIAQTGTEVVTPIVKQAKATVGPIVDQIKTTASPIVDQAQSLVEQTKQTIDEARSVVLPYVDQAKEALSPLVDQTVTPLADKAQALLTPVKRNKALKKSPSTQTASTEQGWNSQALVLTMDVVSHVQRIADRTGDAVLHETARRAHSACAKGLSEAPGVHLVWITPQQANDLVNLAIRTQDHELADFARYCQSVAATTHIGVEPTPGKIQEEILKGYQELLQQGRVHTGPGYGAAFASVNKTYTNTTEGGQPTGMTPSSSSSSLATPNQQTGNTQQQQEQQAEQVPVLKKKQLSSFNEQGSVTKQPELVLTMDVVSHIQRIADRTGNPVLHETARKAHSACAKGLSEYPGVHLTWVTPQQASELMNLASRTLDQELIDFARYCQSVAATTRIAVEPSPGKIQSEIVKGRLELQQMQLKESQSQDQGQTQTQESQTQTQTQTQPVQALSAMM